MCVCSLQVVTLLLEREPTIILEPRPESSCPLLAHSSSYTQPPRTEVSMETTLSSRAKDYSFVTDGKGGERKGHKRSQKGKKDTHSHLHTWPRGDCESSDSYIVVSVRVIQS